MRCTPWQIGLIAAALTAACSSLTFEPDEFACGQGGACTLGDAGSGDSGGQSTSDAGSAEAGAPDAIQPDAGSCAGAASGAYALSATALDFGESDPGQAPSLPLTIRSVGPNPVTLCAVERGFGTSAEFEFVLQSGLPTALAPGAVT